MVMGTVMLAAMAWAEHKVSIDAAIRIFMFPPEGPASIQGAPVG
jgi:hypothetical protein